MLRQRCRGDADLLDVVDVMCVLRLSALLEGQPSWPPVSQTGLAGLAGEMV